MTLARERCLNHKHREAVARCRRCGRFFCRECISEYNDSMICTFCLKKIVTEPPKRRSLTGFFRIFQIALGILVLWASFYLLGKVLLSVPSTFHDVATTEIAEGAGK